MASKGKQKTTMAKLMRAAAQRERRVEKQARKEARKLAPPADPYGPDGKLLDGLGPYVATADPDVESDVAPDVDSDAAPAAEPAGEPVSPAAAS